jgi:NADH dehydrogenase
VSDKHRVVIVGGGFGGLHTALHLKRAPVEATLIDRRNFHLFQPLLYQVATGTLSPGDIASPLRVVLRRRPNVRVIMGEVTDIDPQGRRVILSDGEFPYDTLVLAPGSIQNYFGHNEWEQFAPGLKSVEAATQVRSRILVSLEAAEREETDEAAQPFLNFVIVGGGPTGVELAGAVAEVVCDSLRRDFRRITRSKARILLIQADDRLLPQYSEDLSAAAKRYLEDLGVEIQLNARVIDMQPERITVKREQGNEDLAAHTILWTAGVSPSPLGKTLADRIGIELDHGRIDVGPDLTIPGHPEIFVIGDLAHANDERGKPLPALAATAQQQGKYVAKAIRRRLEGKPAKPFHYINYGEMATVGRGRALADFRHFKVKGLIAWLLWLFIHLMKLVEFENRLRVFIEWAWSYTTFNRGASLITGENPLPFDRRESQ